MKNKNPNMLVTSHLMEMEMGIVPARDAFTTVPAFLIDNVMIDTDRPTITSGPKEHESDSEVEIADWSIYAD